LLLPLHSARYDPQDAIVLETIVVHILPMTYYKEVFIKDKEVDIRKSHRPF
jgi:hypothetical protein